MAWPDIAAEIIRQLDVSPILTPEDWVEARLYEQSLKERGVQMFDTDFLVANKT